MAMLSHGIPKFQKLVAGGAIQFADPFGLGPTLSFVLTVFAEALCSIFVLVGLATRIATIPMIITMLVAIFSAHSADPFAKKELAVLYLLTFLTLLILGPGKYSLDGVIGGRKRR
jgi:putative oxidoreductase